MPRDILGGGFVDNETNTCINTSLGNLSLNLTKPPPITSLGISPNDQFQIKYLGGDLIIHSILRDAWVEGGDFRVGKCCLKNSGQGRRKFFQSRWARPKIIPLEAKSGWANVPFQ